MRPEGYRMALSKCIPAARTGPARTGPTTRLKGRGTLLDIFWGSAMMNFVVLEGELTLFGGFTAVLRGDWTFFGGQP